MDNKDYQWDSSEMNGQITSSEATEIPAKDDEMAMEFEELLINHVGECGRFQKFVVFYAMLFHLFGAFNNMGTVFVAGTPEHWCATPELDHLDLTEDQTRNLTVPVEEGEYSQCSMYARNYSGWSMADVMDCVTTGCNQDVEVVPCTQGMAYSTEQYQSTVVSEVQILNRIPYKTISVQR